MTRLNPAYLQNLMCIAFSLLLAFFLILVVFGGKGTKKDTGSSEARWAGSGAIALACVLSAFVLSVSAYNIHAVIEQQRELTQKSDEARPEEPELWVPLPVKDPADVYSRGPGSLLRSFTLNHYNLEKTTTKDEETLREELYDLFESNRLTRTRFDLPADFTVREAAPSSEVKKAGSLSEYDRQIKDAYEEVTGSGCDDHAYQYQRINVACLSCLDMLSRQCEEGKCSYRDVWDDFLYYSELAVWALANEYIYGDRTNAGKVDLFYRLAQAYDHVGTAATDNDPPFKHELYFVSAACLELSFRSLEGINFADMGQEYRSAVWDLYMTMHFRMGKFVNDHDDFFKKVTDCSTTINGLEGLTPAEKNEVQEHLDELAEWRLYHRT